MAVNVYILLVALVFAGVVTPFAHAQVTNMLTVSGTVPCSTGGSSSVSTAKPFPDATVNLMCGDVVDGSATTDSNGQFQINTSMDVTDLLANCNVAVNTPLSSCGASLISEGQQLLAELQPSAINEMTLTAVNWILKQVQV